MIRSSAPQFRHLWRGLAPGLFLAFFLLLAAGTATGQSKKISLRFRNVNLHDVFTSLSREGKIKIVATKGVQGAITISVDSVSVMRALSLITEMHGLAYYTSGGIVRVMTAEEYKKRFGKPFRGRLKTEVIRLQRASADQLVKSLFQLKSGEGNVIADSRSNSLILVDFPDVLRDMRAVIKQLDVQREARSFGLNHISVQSVSEIVKTMLSAGGTVTVDAEANEVLVVDVPERLKRVEKYIEEVDAPSAEAAEIITLQYADPEEVTAKLKDVLTPGYGSVLADKATNKLIIRDLPSNMPNVKRLIAALDQKTREVLIEAKIIQVNLSDTYKMGVDWSNLLDRLNGITISSSFRKLADTDAGGRLKATGIKSGPHTISVLIEALQTVGSTNLLSNARITAVDGQEARILVGSTIPYKTIDTRDNQGVLTTFEKVVSVEVGVKLKVTPIINEDGWITMKIRPEVSEVTSFVDNLPVIDKSETETTVLVKDGVTIIIGGLIKDQTIETVNKVPILGSIPILGIPFRSTNRQKIKSELVILLRPQIISGGVDMSSR